MFCTRIVLTRATLSGTALSGSLGLDDAHQTAIRTALLRFLEADPALSKVPMVGCESMIATKPIVQSW